MSGSTNKEINNLLMNKYKIKNFLGCFYADELPKNIPVNSCLIVNYSSRGEEGTHWCSMLNLNTNLPKYFDPFGFYPDANNVLLHTNAHLLKYIKSMSKSGRFLYSNENIESINGDTCGHYCCYTIITQSIPTIETDDRWSKFITSQDPVLNDKLIKSIIKL